MNYTHIPQTTLQPATICLGSSHLGSTIDPESAFRLLDAYLDYGGNFIDTANVYANWLPGERSISEKTIGRWLRLRKNRDKVIVATKGGHPELETMHIPRLSGAEIVYDIDDSLKNLQVEMIDLYWLHRDHLDYPVGSMLETLNAQVKAGKIRYFGCSNWRPDRIRAAQAYAAAHQLDGFVANQMMWSLAQVNPASISDPSMVVMDAETKAYHQESGLTAIPYSAQAQGFFQKMAQGRLAQASAAWRARYQGPTNQQRFEKVKHLATTTGLSITEITLGYLQSQPFTTIPIVGCRTIEQLEDSVIASEVHLTTEHVRYLEAGA